MNNAKVAEWLREAADRHIRTRGEDVFAEILLQRAAQVESMTCDGCRKYLPVSHKCYPMQDGGLSVCGQEGHKFGCIHWEQKP